MRDKLKNEATDTLFKAILQLRDLDECYAFFEDLCTINELQSMAQRFEVATMLKSDQTYLARASKQEPPQRQSAV